MPLDLLAELLLIAQSQAQRAAMAYDYEALEDDE